MKITSIALLLLCVSADVRAQSLQIGGLEVTIGESFERALERLSAVYEMQYLESSSNDVEKLWWVRRRAPGREVLGMLRERNGAVTAITRDLAGSSATLARDFTRLLDEAQRLGGVTECRTMANVARVVDGGLILMGYRTVCGRYSIDHGIAWQVRGLPPSQESLSISVR